MVWIAVISYLLGGVACAILLLQEDPNASDGDVLGLLFMWPVIVVAGVAVAAVQWPVTALRWIAARLAPKKEESRG